MENSRRQFEVQLSLGSLVYLSGLVGFCGGITFGMLETLYALIEGEWLTAIGALVLNPFIGGVTFALFAFAGFPIYKRISQRTPTARQLKGAFVESSASIPPRIFPRHSS